MENTIITKSDIAGVSDEMVTAKVLHQRICDAGKAAVNAISEMGKNLKEMRDRRCYETLGYSTFAEYLKNNGDYSFEERQAYNYIRISEKFSETFLQSNANLGVTKLELLTKLNNEQVQDLTESNDLCGMTVAEIKQLVKDKQGLGEQLSLLQAEYDLVKEEKEEQNDVTAEKLKDLQEEIENLKRDRNLIKLSADDLREKYEDAKAKISDLEDTDEPEPRELTSEEIEEVKKTYRSEVESEIESLKKANADKLEQMKSEVSRLKEQVDMTDQKAKAEREKLEQQLKNGGDDTRTALKFYFEQTQTNVSAFVEKLNSIEDKDTQDKFKAGCIKWLQMVIADLVG